MRRLAARRAGTRRSAALLAVVLCGLALGAGATGAGAAPRGLQLGVVGDTFLGPDAVLREAWAEKARRARADLVLLGANWRGIAPARPPRGFRAADPAEPAYDFAALDGAVRAAVRHGLQPVLAISDAPAWAEGPGRPSTEVADAGTWMPGPKQLARFARALALRYAGSFDDPARPGDARLPRVRHFQIWAEQNLSVHLTPQWRRGKPFAPTHYRRMLNAAYAAIHGANPGAKVLVGGLSPYGDPRRGAERIPPVWFWRFLLCLRGPELRPVRCPEPARFDIWAHNPINVGGPGRGALNPFDASTPDIGRLTRIVRRAVRTGRALPARHKPFWATEIWWDSKPPDPDGVPFLRHARFVTRALFLLWRQGAEAVVWWYLRDQSHAGGFAGTQQSGLFFRDGRPKPAYRAFRLPFIAGRDRQGRLFVWGRAPRPGRLVVERRARDSWVPLLRTRAARTRMFGARLRAPGPMLLRARQGGEVSLPWRARG